MDNNSAWSGSYGPGTPNPYQVSLDYSFPGEGHYGILEGPHVVETTFIDRLGSSTRHSFGFSIQPGGAVEMGSL